MVNVTSTHPMKLLHIGYLNLDLCKIHGENILLVTDHYTQYAQAYVTKSQVTQGIDRILWEMFIIHYRVLENILLDQGKTSRIILF